MKKFGPLKTQADVWNQVVQSEKAARKSKVRTWNWMKLCDVNQKRLAAVFVTVWPELVVNTWSGSPKMWWRMGHSSCDCGTRLLDSCTCPKPATWFFGFIEHDFSSPGGRVA